MTTNVPQLVASFHNVPGITIAEKRKHFSTCFNQIIGVLQQNENLRNDLFQSLVPKTHLESLFKTELLIHLRDFPRMVDILKGENKIFIGKLLKNHWFIKELIKRFTPEQLVNELFALTSYSVRLKIINKLLKHNKNVQYADELFEHYSKKYGIHAAKQLLPACSSAKIYAVATNKDVKLSSSILKRLLRKDVTAVLFLPKKFSDKNMIVRYVASRDAQMFVQMLQKRQLDLKLSRTVTHKLILRCRGEVMSNPVMYSSVLNHKQLIYDLGEDFGQFYAGCFPPTFEKAQYCRAPLKILEQFSENKRMQLHFATFRKLFNVDFEEKPELMTTKMLDILNNAELRHRVAEIKYNENRYDQTWIIRMPTEKSIPLIIELIEKDIYEECKWITSLVRTCKINEDTESLLEVFEYVLENREDYWNLRDTFMREVFFGFAIEQLSDEHWEYIDELLELSVLNNEYFSMNKSFVHKRIIFLLRNCLPVEERLVEYLKEEGIKATYNFFGNSFDLEKRCLLDTISIIPNAADNEEDNARYVITLFNCIHKYNTRNATDAINVLEAIPVHQLINSLQILISDSTIDTKLVYEFFICRKDPPTSRSEAIKIFWQQAPSCFHISLVNWFLRYEPTKILEYWPAFLKFCLSEEKFCHPKTMDYCRKNININHKLLEICLSEIDIEESEYRNQSVQILSFLMRDVDYLNLIKKYCPKELHVDVECLESTHEYLICRSICHSLKNILTPSIGLSFVLPFCKGDYLKLSLEALYYLFAHTAEGKLYPAVEELITKAVSVRKHAIFLSCSFLNVSYICVTLGNIAAKDDNVSMRAHLLTAATKYFCKIPNDDMFQLLAELIKNVDKNDEESFKFYIKKCRIPKKYVPRYVQHVWEVLEENGRNGSELETMKYHLLTYLSNEDFRLMEDGFLDKIVSENFLKVDVSDVKFMYSVLRYLFLVESAEKRTCRMQLVFGIFKQFKATEQENAVDKAMSIFAKQFICFAIATKENYVIDTVKQFLVCFNDYGNPFDAFNEYVMMHLLILLLESGSDENCLEKLATNLCTFADDLDLKYGRGCVLYTSKIINYVVKRYLSKKYYRNYRRYIETMYKLLELIYTISSTVSCSLIVISFFDQSLWISDDSIVYQIYDSIISKLKSRPEAIIKALLQSHIRDRQFYLKRK